MPVGMYRIYAARRDILRRPTVPLRGWGQTPHWREMDSNHRSPARKSRFCCGRRIAGPNGGSQKGLFLMRYRWFESISPSAASLRTFGLSAEDVGFSSRLECHSSDSKIDRPGIGIDPVRPGQLHVGTGANGSELAAGLRRTTSEMVWSATGSIAHSRSARQP